MGGYPSDKAFKVGSLGRRLRRVVLYIKEHLPIHQSTDSATLYIYVSKLMREALCGVSMNTSIEV